MLLKLRKEITGGKEKEKKGLVREGY